MTPETEAPVAQPDEQVLPTESPAEASVGLDTQEPAAVAEQPVAQEDARDIKLQERLRRQANELKQTKDLALQQARELAALKATNEQVIQFINQTQTEAVRARVAQMDPDERLAWLTERAFQPQPAPQPLPPVQADPVSEMQTFVEELNAKYDLDAPLTPEDVGLAANREAWRQRAERMARVQALEEGKEDVPAKKVENTQPKGSALTEEQIIERAAQKLRQEMGIGRPNTAGQAGASKSGASISDLNKMASDTSLSPRARAQKMREMVG